MDSTNNTLKDFQLSGDIKTKSDKKFGKKIVAQIDTFTKSSYFLDRNRRFALNRAAANGRMDMQKFMDLLDMQGQTNYIKLSWKPIMIVNTIISRLVGRWMNQRERATVTAIDPVSTKQKSKGVALAEFVLGHKSQLGQLEQASGVPQIPQDQFVPDDKDHLDLWAHEEQRLPEEILMEKGINAIWDLSGWSDVLKRRILHDSAEVGLVAKETYSDKDGKICDEYVEPENTVYSTSYYPDFRDTSWRGKIASMKLSEIRSMWPNLTEEELFNIAKCAKEWTAANKITSWDNSWVTAFYRPYDDWNVDIVFFELKTLDVDKNLIKTATDGSLYVDKPKKKIDKVYEGNEYVENTVWNIYRGAYVKTDLTLLEWGVKKNQVRPQDYKNMAEADFSFSFYMYQNVGMRNIAIPEKIEEPVEQMILARLKIQQLVAKMRPSGLLVDIDGMQEMDLGSPDGMLEPLQIQRVFDQTGTQYYRGKDAEGNRIDAPIKELANAGSVQQLQQLVELYNYHYQVLKDELGEDPNLIQQAAQPRVTSENIQVSRLEADAATDYMYDAVSSVKEISANKIACLLHDSVNFGSKEYRDLMKEQDVKDRVFNVKIELLPTEQEIAYLDAMLNQAIASNPELVLYLDPFKIKRIARQNVKLAEMYFRQGQRRAIQGQMAQAQQQSEMNGQIQAQAAQQKAQGDMQIEQMKAQFESQKNEELSNAKKEEIALTGMFGLWQSGVPMPAALAPLQQELVTNLLLPLFAKNQQNKKAITEAVQMEQESEQQEAMQQPAEQPQMQEQ